MKDLNLENNHFDAATEEDTLRHYLLMVFFILSGRLKDKIYRLEGLVLDHAKGCDTLKLPYKEVKKYTSSFHLPFSGLPTVSTGKTVAKPLHEKQKIERSHKVRTRWGFKLALIATIWVAFGYYMYAPKVVEVKPMTMVDAIYTLAGHDVEASEDHYGITFRTLKVMEYTMDRLVDTGYDGVDPFRFHHTVDIKTTTPIKRTEPLVTTTVREAAKVANQFSEADGLSTCYTIHEHLHGVVRLKCTGYSIPTADELEQITQGHRDENELDERSPAIKVGLVRFVLNN